MLRFSVFASSLLIAGVLLIFSKVEAQQTAIPIAGTHADTELHHKFEQETFFLVNQYRKANKLPPLQWDNAIAQVARLHSRDMATGEVDFGHDRFGSRVSQLKMVMVGLRGAGENVLETDDPNQVSENAVALWLRSPAHLHNIRGDYNYSALGVWQNKDGVIYFTQIFVKIQPQAQTVQVQAPFPAQVSSPFGLLAPPQTRTQP
jgi:uncharacterized protein YkwD